MAGGYGAGFYESIQLQVEARGQAGVNDLAQAFQKANGDVAAFQAQLKAGAPITADTIAEMQKLRDAARAAGEALMAGQRVAAGMPAQLQATGNAARGASDALLQLSRGLEDLSTGGPVGILNNLPGIARGIGTAFKATAPQIAAAETAIGLFGTAAYLAYANWDKIKRLFDDGTGPKLLPDLKELGEQLDALKDKKLPTLVEQQDTKILERQVELLERRKAAQAAQGGQTEDQKASGQAVNKAIVEATGGDRSKLVDAVVAARGGPAESGEVKEIRRQMDELAAKIAAETNEHLKEQYKLELFAKQVTIPGQKAADVARARQGANELINDAGAGDARSLGELTRLIANNRNKTDAQGIDTNRLLRGLDQADPELIRSKREEKEHKAENAEIERGEREIEQEVEGRVRDAVRSIKGGVDDALEDGIQSALRSGLSREDAVAKAKPALMGALQGRGVDTYIQGKVADALLDAAADKAENNRLEGAPSKLGRQAQQARDKAVNAVMARVQGGYSAEAERALYDGIKAGGDPNRVGQGEHRDLAKALRDRGDVPADLVEEVATRIIDKARDKALNDLDSGQKPAAVTKEDAALKKQAGQVAPGYLPRAVDWFAENARARMSNVPVVRTERERQRAEAFGQPYALDEEDMNRLVSGRIARGLRASGQDPRLAPIIAAEAQEKSADTFARNFGASGNPMASIGAVIGQNQGMIAHGQDLMMGQANMVAGLEKKNAELWANQQRVGNAIRRNQRSRPSTLINVPGF